MVRITTILRPLLAAALIFATAAGAATEAQPDPAQAAAENAKKLDAGLARLQPYAGRWLVVANQLDDAQQWVEQERVKVQFKWVIGKRLLETEGRMQATDFRMSLSFDSLKSVYRLALIDSGSGVLDIYEGDFDIAGTLILTNPDHFQWRLETSAEGWELNYYYSADQGKSYSMFGRNVVTAAAD